MTPQLPCYSAGAQLPVVRMAVSLPLRAPARTREPAQVRPPARRVRIALRERLTFLAFVAPNLLLLAVFSYWPLVQNVWLSFVEWNMISPDRPWVGLENWALVLSGSSFRQIALNTLLFTALSVGLTLALGLACALLLNQRLVGRSAARAVLFTPTLLPGSAIALVWIYMLDPRWGLVRTVLSWGGIASPRWLIDPVAKTANAILCGYAFACLRFPRKELLFLVVLAALMIPEEVTVLPNYLTVASVGWVNTYAGLMVPTFASAFGTFLMRQHFLSLPHEVLDAARVDGAGHWRTLWDVALPMSRLVVVTLFMLTVVQRWNEFFWPLIVTNTASMRTLPIGIYYLFSQEGTTQWGVIMAGVIFVVLPVIVLFLFVQRYVVEGIAAGAVKG